MRGFALHAVSGLARMALTATTHTALSLATLSLSALTALFAQDSTQTGNKVADTATVIATRPGARHPPTFITHIIDQDDLRQSPSRGIDIPLTLQPGVLTGGYSGIASPPLYTRGGVDGVYEERLEGAPIGSMFGRGRGVAIGAEAVEQIRVHAGGDAAEFGGSGDGLVQTRLRTGGPDRWKLMLRAETDRYAPMDKGGLGGYSYGYSDWTATAGGPAPVLGNSLRLFGSVQNTFYRDPAVSARSGFDFSGANGIPTNPGIGPSHPNTLKSDTLNLVLPGGNTPGGLDNRWIASGTAELDLSPVHIRLAGSYGYERSRTPADIATLLDQSRLPLNIDRNGFISARLTHEIAPTFRYELGLSYTTESYVTEDPELLGNLFAYGDPAANAALGYTVPYLYNWNPYYLWDQTFSINQPGTEIAGYRKTEQQCLSASGAVSGEVGVHELRAGFELDEYTTRLFNPDDPFQWWALRHIYPSPDMLTQALAVQQHGMSFGYDVFGGEISADDTRSGYMYAQGPRRPVNWGAFIQDRMSFPNVTLTLGLRFDDLNSDVPVFTNLPPGPFDGLLPATDYSKAAPLTQLCPRVGISWGPCDEFILHGQFGRFMHTGEPLIPAEAPPVSRITQIETGFSVNPFENLSIDVTGFLKYVDNQQSEVTMNGVGGMAPLGIFQVGDFTNPRGIELSVLLARTGRLSARFNYTFQDLKAAYPQPNDTFDELQLVMFSGTHSLFYDDLRERHRGSAELDYRFGKDDGGPILERLGLNLLLTFNSGHRYTSVGNLSVDPRFRVPIGEPGEIMTPWFWQLDGRIDKAVIFGPLDVDFYVYVINLLGTENAVSVFPRTGDPGNDGWLSTPAGASTAAIYGPQYAAFYKAVVDGKNSGNWGPPRQIRFGVSVEL